jgi:hypothetical protein
MVLSHGVYEGRHVAWIPRGGPGLEWVKATIGGCQGMSVEVIYGLGEMALRVQRDGENVVVNDDPIAECVHISWPENESKSRLLIEVMAAIESGLAMF